MGLDPHALFRETFLDVAAEMFPHDPQARARLAEKLDEEERREAATGLLLATVGVVPLMRRAD